VEEEWARFVDGLRGQGHAQRQCGAFDRRDAERGRLHLRVAIEVDEQSHARRLAKTRRAFAQGCFEPTAVHTAPEVRGRRKEPSQVRIQEEEPLLGREPHRLQQAEGRLLEHPRLQQALARTLRPRPESATIPLPTP
jgi:hypothetical protein